MDAPRVCIAGIEPATGRHLRPTTGRSNPLTRSLLTEEGGTFALGMLIELGEVTPDPTPPEVEDHLFWPQRARVVGQLSARRYLELLRQGAGRRLNTIFGDDLVRQDWNYAVDQNRGSASLGILRPRRQPDIEIDRYGKLRLRLNDERERKPAFLPVTDVRFVEPDHKTVKQEVLADVRARLHRGVETLLMLGLARAFTKPGDDRPRHWLQVNGICMTDRPLGPSP